MILLEGSAWRRLVDCHSEIESEGHAPGESGQGAKHSNSGAIASICNAAMIAAHMAGTPIFTVKVHESIKGLDFTVVQKASFVYLPALFTPLQIRCFITIKFS